MKGTKTPVREDAQTSLRLPQELRDRLGSAAGAAGRSVGEEIRRRLEASFGRDPAADDPETARLARMIIRLVEAMSSECERPWHEDPWAVAVVRAALPLLVLPLSGDPKPRPGSLAETLYRDLVIEDFARGIAAAIRAENRKVEPVIVEGRHIADRILPEKW